MDQTEKLLHEAYKTSKMGGQAIGTILPKTENRELRALLLGHLASYEDLTERIAEELKKCGEEPKENLLSEATSSLAIQFKAGMDKETTNLAEMLMNGAVMGIVESMRAKRIYPEASAVAQEINGQTLSLCQTVFDDMKPFL